MRKWNSPNRSVTEGFQFLGHSNWIICSLFSQFCIEIFSFILGFVAASRRPSAPPFAVHFPAVPLPRRCAARPPLLGIGNLGSNATRKHHLFSGKSAMQLFAVIIFS